MADETKVVAPANPLGFLNQLPSLGQGKATTAAAAAATAGQKAAVPASTKAAKATTAAAAGAAPAAKKAAAPPKAVAKKRAAKGASKPIVVPPFKEEYEWAAGQVAFSLLPLAPGRRRRTLITEVVRNTIWTLDQVPPNALPPLAPSTPAIPHPPPSLPLPAPFGWGGQIQGVINVNVPVRAVVVKLSGKAGGLLIYNPVGPTEENLALVRD